MTDGETIEKLRTQLMVLLDQVDYTAGACRANEMVGAVLPSTVILSCRELLAETKP